MSYRIFSRAVWKQNPSWPDGYEPLAVPMDRCRTLEVADTRHEARTICRDRNERWARYQEKVREGTATPTQIRTFYEAPRYEFTEVTA